MISLGRCSPWAPRHSAALAWSSSLALHLVLVLVLVLQSKEVQGLEYVVGVAGGRTELPCHLHTEQVDDRAILALWYKQGRRLPVFSYDARGKEGLYQPDKILVGRGTYETGVTPTRLILDPVLSSDEGVYTCRVDFLSSPTHNTVVNLTVIEPPEKLTIYNSDDNLVRRKVSSINEGTPLSLYCVVNGGRPQPTVTWWSEQHMVERKSEVTRDGAIKSKLYIPEVKRSHHDKKFACKAHNNNQQKPLMQEVIIDMNLRPLSVSIKTPTAPLVAGRQYTFTCESNGSKPPAVITWFVEGKEVDARSTQTRSSPVDITTGTVNLVPSKDDHGKVLKCQAENTAITGSAISRVVDLNVHYPPVVKLEMGKNLVPQAIKQGDDVYFECKVTANPEPYRITWERDSERVKPNQTAGVILSGMSLVLQKVARSSAGEYTCSATNTQGTQLSNPVRLDVMYPPECMVDQPTVLAVGRGERVNISCRVSSNPPRATFHWRLNGSERTYTSKGEPLSRANLVSNYNFIGAADKDYGFLHCWANNSIGVQEKHCIFQIIPAGPPSSPEHCEIINNTAENIEVLCQQGFDGGMQQMFLAEVYDEGGSLHLNRSSEEPQFSVESLRPGTTYTIKVSAYNDKGRSPPISLTAVTLKVAEQRVADENASLLYSPLIIIFITIVSVFLILIVILVFVTRWRKNNSAACTTSPSVGSPPLASTASETAEERIQSKEEPGEPQKKKPKKKVVVIENGMKDRVNLGDGQTEVTSSKDALLGRHTDSQPLANGSAGFYNSLGKTSFPSTFPASSSSHSSSTLPRSHKSSASSSTLPRHHALISPHKTTSLTVPEEDFARYSNTTRYSETLPRNMGRGGADGGGGGFTVRGVDIYRSGSSHGGEIFRSKASGAGLESVGYRSDGYRKSVGDQVDIYRGGSETYRSSDKYRGGDVEQCSGDVYRSGRSGGAPGGGILVNKYSGGGGGGSGDGGSHLGKDVYHGSADPYHSGSHLGSLVDTYRTGSDISGGGGSGGGRGGKEKYHLLQELKNNPKYVVRTRACEPNDESFV